MARGSWHCRNLRTQHFHEISRSWLYGHKQPGATVLCMSSPQAPSQTGSSLPQWHWGRPC
eukprot:1060830-Pelagomonas_calceolata.AAC.1